MKGYAMLKIGESGWIEKERPVCGPLDAICRPLAVAICTSDVHTLWEGAIGERHNMILGHECCAEVVEVGELVKDFKPGSAPMLPNPNRQHPENVPWKKLNWMRSNHPAVNTLTLISVQTVTSETKC